MSELSPSRRLVDQRVRNRIMEAILGLSEGDAGVDKSGTTEWFESFFDYFPYDGPEVSDVTSINGEEWSALTSLLAVMQTAFSETSGDIAGAELIVTGWPARIARIAAETLSVFLARGRFSEEAEEQTPSSPAHWP